MTDPQDLRELRYQLELVKAELVRAKAALTLAKPIVELAYKRAPQLEINSTAWVSVTAALDPGEM
jgi:hypothetical protein